jgi:hypothetical protein
LFADRFRAHTDVYAVRWENTCTGASGWSPAVAGGWRKGVDRRNAVHLPRTPQVVAAQLVGDVFMGLYPLLPEPRSLPAERQQRPVPFSCRRGAALNTVVVQYYCDSDPSRVWRLVPDGTGQAKILNVKSGLCLSPSGPTWCSREGS